MSNIAMNVIMAFRSKLPRVINSAFFQGADNLDSDKDIELIGKVDNQCQYLSLIHI